MSVTGLRFRSWLLPTEVKPAVRADFTTKFKTVFHARIFTMYVEAVNLFQNDWVRIH